MLIFKNFILVSLLTASYLFSQNNFDKYKSGLEYIKKDTLLGYSKNDIFISSEIAQFTRYYFIRSIVQYEYKLTDKEEIFLTADSLMHLEDRTNFKSYKLDTLNSLNINWDVKKYVLFFSEIMNNQFYIEIIYNIFDYMNPSYKQASWNLNTYEFLYYFYFDDDNNIVKVFKGRADF